MGNVVLFYPHTGLVRTEDQIVPLSLLYVAAPLVREGYEVTLIDQRKEPDWRAALTAALAEPKTLAAGISAMTGAQIRHGLEAARAIREAAPGLPIVWGGVHPSLLPEQTARSRLVDVVVVGEGEEVFAALIRAIDAGRPWDDLPGLCFQRDGQVVRTPPAPVPDLDALPPLPYELIGLDRYAMRPLRSRGSSLPIVTSRGCAFRCGYCYNTQFHGRRWRGQSPDRVMAEVRTLVDGHGAKGIFLLDDNFFGNRTRAETILQRFVAEGAGLPIYNANARVDFLARSTPAFLELMCRAGIEQVFVGIESGCDRVLDRIGKDITVAQSREVNRMLRDAGIVPVYGFMAGLPDETWDEVLQTLELMVALRRENPQARLYKVSLFAPMPGTALCERCRELGGRLPERFEDWATYDYDHANLNYMTPRDRCRLERIAELSGFLDVEGRAKGLLRILVRAYSVVATWRCERRRVGWMPEMAAIRLLRAWRGA